MSPARAHASTALSVACEHCGAAIGRRCRDRHGKPRAPHGEREQAVRRACAVQAQQRLTARAEDRLKVSWLSHVEIIEAHGRSARAIDAEEWPATAESLARQTLADLQAERARVYETEIARIQLAHLLGCPPATPWAELLAAASALPAAVAEAERVMAAVVDRRCGSYEGCRGVGQVRDAAGAVVRCSCAAGRELRVREYPR